MSANTKIIVLKSKELIFTGIFLLLGALLLLLLFYMFSGNKHSDNDSSASSESISEDATSAMVHYSPGVYSSTLNLGGTNLHMIVTVEEDKISNVYIDTRDETITVMYPLLAPCLDEINANLPFVNSIDDITFSGDNQYTTLLLVDAIKSTVEPAISY